MYHLIVSIISHFQKVVLKFVSVSQEKVFENFEQRDVNLSFDDVSSSFFGLTRELFCYNFSFSFFWIVSVTDVAVVSHSHEKWKSRLAKNQQDRLRGREKTESEHLMIVICVEALWWILLMDVFLIIFFFLFYLDCVRLWFNVDKTAWGRNIGEQLFWWVGEFLRPWNFQGRMMDFVLLEIFEQRFIMRKLM